MKLDFKNNSELLVTEVGRLLGLAPIFTMMCAVVMVILASFSVNDLLRVSGAQKKSGEQPEFNLKKEPVGKGVYSEYAQILSRLSPDVQVTAERDSIRIEVGDTSKYAEFMYVLNSVQGLSKDVIWQAEEICLAGCVGKPSFAQIKGMREKVNVKLRGNENE